MSACLSCAAVIAGFSWMSRVSKWRIEKFRRRIPVKVVPAVL
jgi:hypothetical protein